MRYTDAHCHAHEMPPEELEAYSEVFEIIVAVSDDLESSMRTLDLAERYKFLHPCVGIHPWTVGEARDLEEQLRGLEKLVAKGGVTCLGEIGLDKAFVPQTLDRQLEVFRRLLDLARDYDLAVNLHAAKAWRLVLAEVVARGVRRALFHWFTGPLDVLREVVARGYLVSINPTVKISSKHMAVAKAAPLHAMVFESDGPYEYRGLSLRPSLVPETVQLVAEERGVAVEELVEASRENLMRFLGLE